MLLLAHFLEDSDTLPRHCQNELISSLCFHCTGHMTFQLTKQILHVSISFSSIRLRALLSLFLILRYLRFNSTQQVYLALIERMNASSNTTLEEGDDYSMTKLSLFYKTNKWINASFKTNFGEVKLSGIITFMYCCTTN